MSIYKIYYGEGSDTYAKKYAESSGVVHDMVYGEKGLSIDECRRLTEDLSSPPIYRGRKMVLVGPLDSARINTLDSLLKTLEDSSNPYTEPVFWTRTLKGIPETIVSRCELIWVGEVEATKTPFSGLLSKKKAKELTEECFKYRGSEHLLLSLILTSVGLDKDLTLTKRLRDLSTIEGIQVSEILGVLYKVI